MPRLSVVAALDTELTEEDEKRIAAACLLGVDVMEIHSPERIIQLCQLWFDSGGVAGSDEWLGPHSQGPEGLAWNKMSEGEPGALIGSPRAHSSFARCSS